MFMGSPAHFAWLPQLPAKWGCAGGGIEGLLARRVGGTMGELPVVNARATANSQGHCAALAMWGMGYCTAARMVLLGRHENVDDENAGRTASLA